MWPFGKRKAERDRIRSAFAKYLSPEALDRLARNPKSSMLPSTEAGRIYFVLCQIRDDDPKETISRLSRVLEAAQDSSGMIHTMLPMVLVTFGFPSGAYSGRDDLLTIANCVATAARLVQSVTGDAKAVYGSAEGRYGAMGTARRLLIGAAIPSFSRAFAQLQRLEFGGTAEIDLPEGNIS